nr:hypothetical protein CFP56_12089 [Quercus suber]
MHSPFSRLITARRDHESSTANVKTEAMSELVLECEMKASLTYCIRRRLSFFIVVIVVLNVYLILHPTTGDQAPRDVMRDDPHKPAHASSPRSGPIGPERLVDRSQAFTLSSLPHNGPQG